MNRKWVPLLIAAGVLVPFFALVSLAWWSTDGRAEGVVASPVKEPLAHALYDAGPRFDAGLVTAPPLAQREEVAPQIPEPLRVVQKEATRCLSDASPLQPIVIEVHFTPTRDGGFSGVSSNAQDPMLAACIEDVFDELSFDPQRTTDFVPTTHTFRFEPGSP